MFVVYTASESFDIDRLFVSKLFVSPFTDKVPFLSCDYIAKKKKCMGIIGEGWLQLCTM